MLTAEIRPLPVGTTIGPVREPAASDRIAVLVPCYNEEVTVAQVIEGFREALPGAAIYVFDNNSTDATARVARDHGAAVVSSLRQGKGNVVRHMFETVEADIYVLVDGDATYPPESAPALIAKLQSTAADMVVGTRLSSFGGESFRRFHLFGNRMMSWIISRLFSIRLTDVLSGYRVFSRDFVKSVPLVSQGFEIETELTLQAAAKSFRLVEHPVPYGSRPEGSVSKLSTFSDGYIILRTIFAICKDYKPLMFFLTLSLVLALASIACGIPPILDYYHTRFVTHVPMAILAAGIGITSVIFFVVGVMLDTINKYHNENFVMHRRLIRLVGEAARDGGEPRAG
jgi:glycosyltransferase involved in cell wall biosynthesis